MGSLPPEAILLACVRWLRLLRTSSVAQAGALIAAGAEYADLTLSQYETAFEHLRLLDLTNADTSSLADGELARLLVLRLAESERPAWLASVSENSDDLPLELGRIASTFNLDESELALEMVFVAGKISREHLAEIGARGEAELVSVLRRHVPNVQHVSLVSDGFGYDLSTEMPRAHIEVKTTIRRGKLTVFLSRHEFRVASADPSWHLVVLALADGSLEAVATVSHEAVLRRAPDDVSPLCRWESIRLDLLPEDLLGGLPFLADAYPSLAAEVEAVNLRGTRVDWFPSLV